MSSRTALSQDFVLIMGTPTPGRAQVLAGNSPRKWDERAGHGLAGASTVYTGDSLAKFKIQIDLWEVEHFALWKAFSTVVKKPPKGVRPIALDVIHPILADLDITQAVVVDRSQLTQIEDGLWSTTIDFLQYRKPTPVLAKPAQAIPGASSSPAQDPPDPEIAAAMARNNAQKETNDRLASGAP